MLKREYKDTSIESVLETDRKRDGKPTYWFFEKFREDLKCTKVESSDMHRHEVERGEIKRCCRGQTNAVFC